MNKFVSIKADHVLLSCVKPAERASEGGDDSSRDVIVRLYSLGKHDQVAKLRVAFPILEAWECDLAETKVKPLSVVEGAAPLPIRPFEIKTVRITPAKI